MARIAFDAKRFYLNRTGLGNYSRTLIGDLAAQYPEHDYLLFSPKTGEPGDSFAEAFRHQVYRPEGIVKGAFWRTWGIPGELVKEKADLYHGLAGELPRNIRKAGIPSIVTIHDLIFRHFPDHYSSIDARLYDWKARNACEMADHIIAISSQTKKDIIEAYGTDPGKISVIYQACDRAFSSPGEEVAFEKESNLPKDYLLFVGSFTPRKNPLRLLKAWEGMNPRPPLVMVGGGSLKQEIQTFIHHTGTEKEVFLPEIAESKQLASVYRNALAFVYPSLYEGFGIPVIEALWSGTAVVTSGTSSMPEAGGPDSLYVDPMIEDSIRSALQRVVDDGTLRTEMIAKGSDYVRKFENERVSREVMMLYKRLL